MPVASLVIPVAAEPAKPGGPSLFPTLAAALSQTCLAYEVIIVDAGASLADEAVMDQFLGDPRVRRIRRPGVDAAGARAAGIAAAESPCIGFCAPGALWRPGALAGHIRHFADVPGDGVSLSEAERVMNGDRPSPLRSVFPTRRLSVLDLMASGDDAFHSTALVRRAALEALAATARGGALWDERMAGAGGAAVERDLWLRMTLRTGWSCGLVPAPLTTLDGGRWDGGAAAPAARPAAAASPAQPAAAPATGLTGLRGLGAAALSRIGRVRSGFSRRRSA